MIAECEICGASPNNIDNPVQIFKTGKNHPCSNPHWRCEKHLHTPLIGQYEEFAMIIERNKKKSLH